MPLRVASASTAEIADLLKQNLAEANRQIVQHARFRRGWTDNWLIALDGVPIGYGAMTGDLDERPRDRLFQFFLLAEHRHLKRAAFETVALASGAKTVACQTNDPLLSEMYGHYADPVEVHALLFAAGHPASHTLPGATFRPRREDDVAFEHTAEPLGDYLVEIDGRIVGTGGYLTHYNPPYVDIYMEVAPDMRRRGVGRFVVQEVMRVAFAKNLIPSARTGPDKDASRATLLSAGFVECGKLISGRLRPTE